LAAGLHELPGIYYFDALRAASLPADFSKGDREVGVYAVLGLDELSAVPATLDESDGRVVEVADAMGIRPSDAYARLSRLFQCHAREWHGFLHQIPTDSWIGEIVDSPKCA
jgi:hypothetical protein